MKFLTIFFYENNLKFNDGKNSKIWKFHFPHISFIIVIYSFIYLFITNQLRSFIKLLLLARLLHEFPTVISSFHILLSSIPFFRIFFLVLSRKDLILFINVILFLHISSSGSGRRFFTTKNQLSTYSSLRNQQNR